MNSDYRGILLLMKSAITRQPEVLPEGFDLEAQLELLKMHHVYPLIYDGAVRCGIPQQESFMQKLFQLYIMAIRKSDGQQRQLGQGETTDAVPDPAGYEALPPGFQRTACISVEDCLSRCGSSPV